MKFFNKTSIVATLTSVLLLSFNAAAAPESAVRSDDSLGGGFVKGMTPTQACLVFKKHYRSRNEHNALCRLIGHKDFANLTVLNRSITNGVKRHQHIENIAFFFNEDEELNLVMSVEDARYDEGDMYQPVVHNQISRFYGAH